MPTRYGRGCIAYLQAVSKHHFQTSLPLHGHGSTFYTAYSTMLISGYPCHGMALMLGLEPCPCWLQDPTGEAASQAQKHLTYYELDFGLNHVARKWSDPVDNGANLLIPVPGGGDGPGGVLVAADNFIIYKDQDHAEARPGATSHHAVVRVTILPWSCPSHATVQPQSAEWSVRVSLLQLQEQAPQSLHVGGRHALG